VIAVNPTGLSSGTTYNGQIVLTAGGVSQTVPVSLVVGGTAVSVAANPAAVTLSNVPPGGATASTSQVQVTSPSGTAQTFTIGATTAGGGNWLSVLANGTAVTSATTPVTLTISVNSQSLQPGTTYTGTVTLTPAGGTALQIPVSVTTSAQPTVSAAPAAGGSSLSFSYRAGDNTPSPLSISVTGGSGLAFTATAKSDSGNWLSVSPLAGTTPATLSVSISPSGLAAGTYNGSITVAGTGGATGTSTIPVSLTVTAPLPTITQLGNSASYVGGSISPGEIITVFGTGLGPTPAVQSPTVNANGLVATTLGGVSISVNGFAAPILYASNTQVTAVVPYEVARFLSATVTLTFLGQSSNGISAGVAPTAPGVFTANASGTGPGAILNANFTQNSPGNPARAGETVAVYLTGEGQTAPSGVTGKVTTVATTGPLTPQPLLPVGVTIGGQPAQVAFYGEAPSLVSGVMQLNVVIPANAPAGNLPLVVTIGSNSSQTGVTVSVR